MKKKTLRDTILQADDSKPEPIEIPEWGIEKGAAFVKPLDGDSRFKISQLATGAATSKTNIYITEAYVVEGLVDEDGEQIFSWDDRALLAKKNPEVLERIYRLVVKASGIRLEDGADAEKK